MKKIALWEAKHPKTVLLLALLLLIPALIGFACTGVNYDILSYLPDELESMQGEQVLDETFNTAGISIVITEDMQPKYTLALKNEILKVEGISSVIWVDTLADIGIPADALPDVLKNIFYSADGTKTMMLVRYDPAGGEGSDLKAIAQIKTLLGENAFMSGLSVIVDDTREICDSQAPLYIAVAVALALAVMALMMESWFQPLIVLLSLGIAVLYNMGTNFFLGEISFITQCVAAVLQLGVTMDYSIFLIDRYSEEKEHYPTREEVMAAVGEGVLPVQHAVLERYHDLVKLAEQRHQLPHTQLIRIRADGAAGDTVITCAVIGLAFKVYLEGGRVLLLLLGRIPRGVLHDVLLVLRLALSRVQIRPAEVPLDMIQRTAYHLLHGLRRDLFLACHIRSNKGQRKQLVIRHGVVVPDIVRLRDQLLIDFMALFHDLCGVLLPVFLRENLLYRSLEHPEIKTVMSQQFPIRI